MGGLHGDVRDPLPAAGRPGLDAARPSRRDRAPVGDQVAKIQAAYGLNDPLWVQYWHQLVDALQLDFGRPCHGASVTELLAQNLPPTLALTADRAGADARLGVGLAFLAT